MGFMTARTRSREPADDNDEDKAEAPTPQNGFPSQSDPLAKAFEDPLASDEEAAATDYTNDATPFDDDYKATFDESGYTDGEVSQFEYRAPFTTRRNPLKMWNFAAAIFALMALGTVAAVNFYSLPEWAPFNRPAFGIGKPDLVLSFPEAQQREETLENGVEIFRVRGSITNAGSAPVSVPQLVIVFKDTYGNAVFSKPIAPAKSELAPGESLNVVEAVSGYPSSAATAAIGWAPG